SSAASPNDFPTGDRRTLHGGWRRRRLLRWRNKLQMAGLRPGFGFDFQRAVVLPTDSDTARDTHYRGSSICLALLTRGFVLGGIPRIGDFPSFSRNRNGFIVTLLGRDHASVPISAEGRKVADAWD